MNKIQNQARINIVGGLGANRSTQEFDADSTNLPDPKVEPPISDSSDYRAPPTISSPPNTKNESNKHPILYTHILTIIDATKIQLNNALVESCSKGLCAKDRVPLKCHCQCIPYRLLLLTPCSNIAVAAH